MLADFWKIPEADTVRKTFVVRELFPAIGKVVDERLNVIGVEGLMVVDASVFPENIANNLNMTCYMVGERAAAFVDGRE